MNSYPSVKAQSKNPLPALHATHLTPLPHWSFADGHVSCSASPRGQTPSLLRTVTGAAPSECFHPPFLSNPDSLFRFQGPWTVLLRPSITVVCNLRRVYLTPACLPPWNVNSTAARSARVCLLLSSQGLICGGLSVGNCWIDPLFHEVFPDFLRHSFSLIWTSLIAFFFTLLCL